MLPECKTVLRISGIYFANHFHIKCSRSVFAGLDVDWQQNITVAVAAVKTALSAAPMPSQRFRLQRIFCHYAEIVHSKMTQ